MDDPSGKTADKIQSSLHVAEHATSLERTVYFIPATVPSNHQVFTAVKNICGTFDDVLEFLEEGKVDKIVFHPLTSPHERRYIVHWAKVFNPNVVEQLTNHFPSKMSGSHQVA